jgi:hypothetical protein
LAKQAGMLSSSAKLNEGKEMDKKKSERERTKNKNKAWS